MSGQKIDSAIAHSSGLRTGPSMLIIRILDVSRLLIAVFIGMASVLPTNYVLFDILVLIAATKYRLLFVMGIFLRYSTSDSWHLRRTIEEILC